MSVLSQVAGLPGMRAAKTVTSRMVTRGGWIPDILPLGKVLSGGCTRDPSNTPDVGRIRAGVLLGKITSVVNSLGTIGQYAPSIFGVTTNAEAVGSTSIQVSAAVGVEIARRCGATGTFTLTGPAVAGGPIISEVVTYSAISGVNITVTAIANNFIAGSFVQPTDGSEDPLTFVPNGTPIMSTDFDGTSVDQEFGEVPIGCIIDSSMLLPAWPSDAALQAWIVSRLNRAGGGKFTFSHIY